MSLFLASLNSGSNGNCYYLGNETEAVLIDAGISCREVERRMATLGLSLEKVKGIFVSHEHGDHIRGIAVLSKKYRIPVYISPLTLLHSGIDLLPELVKPLEYTGFTRIGSLNVHAFGKIHDAADPCSFTVECGHARVAVITDVGHCCENVVYHFANCDAAVLEANYDSFLLENGRYSFHLKRRISGGKGHISNRQALELFTSHRSQKLTLLLLGHLSADNNDPDIVSELFSHFCGETEVIVASRHEPSPVFHITGNAEIPYQQTAKYAKTVQLTLF